MSSPSTPGLWDSQSNLLLLQLIYKYGDPSDSVPQQEKLAVFDKIASQLSTHTLIRPSKRKYIGTTCEQHYINLLAQESLTREVSLPTTASANKKPAKSVALLAQKLYVAHLTHLKSEIQSLEQEFLNTTKEIESIERGEWDDRFRKQIAEQQQQPEENGLKRAREEEKEEGEEGEEEQEVEREPPAKRSRVGSENEGEVKEEPVEDDTKAEEEPVEESMEEVEETAEPETAEPVEPKAEAETESELEPDAEPEAENEPQVEPVEVDEPEPPMEEEVEQPEGEEPEARPATPTPAEKEVIDIEDQGEETEEEPAKPADTKPEEEEHESDSLSTLTREPTPVEAEAEADHTPTRPKKPFPTLIQPLHASLCSLKSATLFSNPIREIDAPGYAQLIKKPMDLKTLWKLVKDGTVVDSKVYHREVLRMFANAIMYNAENTPVGEMSRDMAREGDKLCEGYRKSENFAIEGGRRKRK